MGSDNRDWHRDWWRKKTGYVERARFRMPEAEYQRQLRAAIFKRRLLFLAVLVALLFLLPRLLRFFHFQ